MEKVFSDLYDPDYDRLRNWIFNSILIMVFSYHFATLQRL